MRVKNDMKRIFMRKRYPSDVTKEQFKKIEPMLLAARKTTRPRKHNLYDVFCAVLYLLKSGCQLRMLPSDFPDWRSVYAYFRIWSDKEEGDQSLLEQVLKKISWRGPYKQWSERENQFRNC
jgi:transposase